MTAPSPDLPLPQVEAESVANDQEFVRLLTTVEVAHRFSRELSDASAALVAHIDSIITALVAAAIEQAALICEDQAKEPECPERAQYCADAIRTMPYAQGFSPQQKTDTGI